MEDPMKLPVFMAFLATETNSFAPIPTGLASFEELGIKRRDGSIGGNRDSAGHAFRALAEGDGRQVIESLEAAAQPAGLTVQPVYEQLRDLILEDLKAAGPV